ncbi:MAG: CPBP family intramembrane metalloprotease [Sphingobacteriaceae bacterium]|nr:MAG: CPBP family intramembrane metalloprotease [Sphingobacteriaceae bacterium]
MTINRRTVLSPGIQLCYFILISVAFVFIGYIIGLVIIIAAYGMDVLMQIARMDLSTPDTISALWIIQIAGMTIPLFVGPLFFAYVIVKEPFYYLRPSLNFAPILIVLVLCIMYISSPLIEFLARINQQMIFPTSLKFIYDWISQKEEAAKQLSSTLLQMRTLGSMIKNVLLVGLLTAIAEEFTFRGCLQSIFTRWTKNHHAAIWITAIIFSAFHVQFFGFLPRVLLGALLGYMVAWSGSIWPAVWGHFINNGTAVVATYLYQHKKINVNPDDQHLFNYNLYILSLIIVLFLLFMYKKLATEKKQLQAE